MSARERLPESVHTVYLVDDLGRSWGGMSREDFEEASDAADVFQTNLRAAIQAAENALILRKETP